MSGKAHGNKVKVNKAQNQFESERDWDMDDAPLAQPIMTMKDYMLFLFLAWLLAAWSCIHSQWVMDLCVFYLVTCGFYVLNLIVWRLAGVEFLYKQFLAFESRRKKNAPVMGLAVFAVFTLVWFWLWQVVWMYNDSSVLGWWFNLMPNLKDSWWREMFYWMGVWVCALLMAKLETWFFNLLWDNCCGKSWLWRAVAALFQSFWVYPFLESSMAGPNNVIWVQSAFWSYFVLQVVGFVLSDVLGLAAAGGWRLALIAAGTLNFMGFSMGWFKYDSVKFFHAYSNNNVWM